MEALLSGPLWVSLKKKRADGCQGFFVINGYWDGILNTDGTLTVSQTKARLPCEVLWTGETQFKERDYNEAIAHIEGLIAKS